MKKKLLSLIAGITIAGALVGCNIQQAFPLPIYDQPEKVEQQIIQSEIENTSPQDIDLEEMILIESGTPSATPTVTLTATAAPTVTSIPTLRSLAQVGGIYIGAAVRVQPLQDDPFYPRTLAREFNILTPENAMKFETIHPDKGRYDFHKADVIIDFAEANDMQVRGHTLVWDSQLPSWLTEGEWTRDELIEILRDHIVTVVGHYRGRVVAWDVVNEAIADDGSLRDTIWLRGIGPEYIEMAFRWVHEADPDALLFYNDYGAEGLSPKSDAVYALVQGLLQQGVPIHGVGFQMHTGLDCCPKPENVAANMKRLSALGLDVHITEMEVKIKKPVTEKKLAQQAHIYRNILDVCLSADNCKAFVMWGFTDRHSYIPYALPGWDAAFIFDESYRPKPAYNALLNVLTESTSIPTPTPTPTYTPSPTPTPTQTPTPTYTPTPTPTLPITPTSTPTTTPAITPTIESRICEDLSQYYDTSQGPSALEHELLERINSERGGRALNVVVWDSEYGAIADMRTEDFLEAGMISHDLDSNNVNDFVELLERYCMLKDELWYGEILARSNAAVEVNVETVFNAFMDSPSHKKAIVNPNYKLAGISVIHDNSEPAMYYYAAIFSDGE